MISRGKAEKRAARPRRLSVALRENLKRRKAQARTRAEQGVEDAIFKLRAGEVSELIPSQDKFPKNVTIAKCDKRIPAETFVSLEAKHDELMAEVRERKLQAAIGRGIRKHPGIWFPSAEA